MWCIADRFPSPPHLDGSILIIRRRPGSTPQAKCAVSRCSQTAQATPTLADGRRKLPCWSGYRQHALMPKDFPVFSR